MLSYKRLIDEHNEITVATRGLEHVCRPATPAPADASMFLLDLAARVDENLRHEDRAVYTELIALHVDRRRNGTRAAESSSHRFEAENQFHRVPIGADRDPFQ